MPAKSVAQRRLFAIAEHNPSALYQDNKRLAQIPEKTQHDFAATKEAGLPKKKRPKHPMSAALGMKDSDGDYD